jgi:hypothetical protein
MGMFHKGKLINRMIFSKILLRETEGGGEKGKAVLIKPTAGQ